MKHLFTLIATVFTTVTAFSQGSVAQGSLAFTAISSDAPDAFQFVVLKPIAGNAVIYFTDNSWSGVALSTGEQTVTYTAPSAGLPVGSVVTMTDNNNGTTSVVGGGSALGVLNGISASGDQIFAYQGTSSNPSFIAAVGNNPWITSLSSSSNNSYLPSTLTTGENAMVIKSVHIDNGYFTCGSGTLSGTEAIVRASIYNQANWTTSDDPVSYPACNISIFIWNGSAWSPSTPTSTDNVHFDGNYTVSAGSSFTANNLTVSSGNTLTLEASSFGYAQLKVNGRLVNQGTVIANQYMTGTGHHSVSSPMSNGFTTTNGTSSALYAYDASTGAYNMSPTLTSAGTGFFAPLETSGFLTSAGTFSATGTPTTSHTHTLSYAQTQVSGGSGSGWNLIGNPYTCGLDWNALTKTNVNSTYYVWDPTSSKYQYYSPSALTGTYLAASSILSGVIAPMQAFWVQVSSSSAASIVSTMAAAGTVTTSPTFYKTAPDNLILYVEDLSDPSLSDAMWITHATGYTNDFEGDQDAWKLHNYGAKASIFSYHNGEKLAINAIDLGSTASVPVGVKAPEVGKKYRLVLEQVVNNQDYRVILEDRLFNSFTDITGQGYGFTHSAWQNEDPRFVVHINQSTVGMGESSASTVKAYQQGERLILQGNSQQHGSYAVSALDGRVIAQGLLQAGMASIVAPQVGVYIVNFIGAAPETQRIVIQ